MADNFDIVEEALRLLSPQRYRGGGEVKRFDGDDDSYVESDVGDSDLVPGADSGIPTYNVATPAVGSPLHY